MQSGTMLPLFGYGPDKSMIRDATIKSESHEIFFAKILDSIRQRHNVCADSCYFKLKVQKSSSTPTRFWALLRKK